jgi:hypothetical protein
MITVSLPAWALLDLRRKFYMYELSVDVKDVKPHFIYTATESNVPLKVIGQIKFTLEDK